MNFVILVLIVPFICAISDFFTFNMPKLQNQIYGLSFLVTYLLCTSKYYYGGDIWIYENFFQSLPENIFQIKDFSTENIRFEVGYTYLCAIVKQLGGTMWEVSAITSTIYFVAIYKLFKYIPSHRSFALYILLVLDSTLILTQFRQSIAVACFIFMALAFWNKRYFLSLLWCIASILFHKSGIFISVPVFILLNLYRIKIDKNIYSVMALILVLMLLIPVIDLILAFTDKLYLTQSMSKSILHHLTLGRQIQTVFFVYIIYIVSILMFRKFQPDNVRYEKQFQWIVLAGTVLIVFLYQYYYLLNRLRSYFLPFIITYMFILADKGQWHRIGARKDTISAVNIIRSISVLIFFVYGITLSISFHRSSLMLKSKIHNNVPTILALLKESPESVKKRQLKKAQQFWDYDYMSDDTNKIKDFD